ncbi:MAG: transposase family protein [Synechococcus sp.]
MPKPAIVEAFAQLEDPCRSVGQRYTQTLCLALFTLAVVAGNQGFLAIGDWLKSYRDQLLAWFDPSKRRLPSYSTIRHVLLNVDYRDYSQCLAEFFEIEPEVGETITMDGKVLKDSYLREDDNLHCKPYPAIMLVSAYIVERG